MARIVINLIATFIALVAVATVDAPAQEPPSTGSQQPPREESRPAPVPKDAAITVTGCVRSAAAPGGFILANTDPATEPRANAPAATPGRGAVDSGNSYTLIPKSGEDLTQHLNHKVEVTGLLGPPTPPSPDGPTTKQIVEPVGTIMVQSLKMVSSSCP